MFNKKAMSTEQVLLVIVVLISLAALLSYIAGPVKKTFTETTDTSVCALSVKNAAALAKLPAQGIKSLKELQGCKTESTPNDEKDLDKVHGELADKVFTCWDMFGRGKLDFARKFEVKDLCFVCYKITFENNLDTNYQELYKYMITKERYKPLLSSRDFDSDSFEKIEKGNKFYIVIVSNKIQQEITGIFTFLLDKWVKFVVDEQEFVKNRVALVRSDKISEYCQEIA